MTANDSRSSPDHSLASAWQSLYFDQHSCDDVFTDSRSGGVQGVNLSLVRSPPDRKLRLKLKAGYLWGSLQWGDQRDHSGFKDTSAPGWQIGGEIDLIRRRGGWRGIWVPLTLELLYRTLKFRNEFGATGEPETVDASGVVIRLGCAWEY